VVGGLVGCAGVVSQVYSGSESAAMKEADCASTSLPVKDAAFAVVLLEQVLEGFGVGSVTVTVEPGTYTVDLLSFGSAGFAATG
jgi:hypothetical protein